MAKLLIVEDSKFQHKQVVRKLQETGHELVSAYNGVEGLAKYEEESPDLIISDILMPEKNGLEMVEELKSKGVSIPIIFYSADIQDTVRMKAMSLGVVDLVNKPDVKKLISVIEGLKLSS